MADDHFTAVAGQYATFRPTYPEALFDWLASIAPGQQQAWDCGAGSGQATVPLSRRFGHVLATDISEAQLAAAPRLPNVEYRIAPAEASRLPDASADLITVAQAMHWFELPRFYAEVRRVLKPGGVIAVWGYNRLLLPDAAIQSAIDHFYEHTIGAYWPAERVHVENGYRDLDFPFPRIAPPHFALTQQWQRAQLCGYLRSWSAVGRFKAAHGHDPVDELERILAAHWPEEKVMTVEWPLFVHCGRSQ